jgi:hypothetical protein
MNAIIVHTNYGLANPGDKVTEVKQTEDPDGFEGTVKTTTGTYETVWFAPNEIHLIPESEHATTADTAE